MDCNRQVWSAFVIRAVHEASPQCFRTFELSRQYEGGARYRWLHCVAYFAKSFCRVCYRVDVCLARRISWRLRMSDFPEQHVCMKFCFKLGKTFLETSEMLKQAFWDETISRTQTCEWYKCFKEGRTSVEDKWALRATFSINKWRKHSKSPESDSIQSSSDCSWSSRGSWNFKNHVSSDSHWKFGHALCCSQICAASAEGRSETKSCWCQ